MKQIRFPKLTHGLILLIFAYLLMPTVGIRPWAGLGAESSWHQALAMVFDNQLKFGTEVIFRYGPLGFLETNFLPSTVSLWVRPLFDLYILANILFVFHYALKKAKIKMVVILAVLVMWLPWGYIAGATFTLLYLFLFNIFHANENRRSITLYNAVFIAALLFFIKANISIVISMLLYASILYLWASHRFSWRELAAVIVTHLFLIFWGAYHLNVAVGPYLKANFYIMDQYDDAKNNIGLPNNLYHYVLITAIIISLSVLVVFFKNVKQVYKRQDYLYTFLMVFAVLYLALKQHFTDLSFNSAMAYFLFLPPLISLLWVFLRDSNSWLSRLAIFVTLVCTLTFQLLRYNANGNMTNYLSSFYQKERIYFNAKYGGKGKENKKREPFIDALTILKLHSPYGYIKSLILPNFEPYLPLYHRANRSLPSDFKAIIGEATVDFLPDEISYIYYNKLNYNPRPSLQSRQAIGEYLDLQNAKKYESKTAPEYLLSNFKNVKEYNSFWEETYTKLSIKNNYKKLLTAKVSQINKYEKSIGTDTLSLYTKKDKSTKGEITKLQEIDIAFGQKIALPVSDDIIILKAKVSYSHWGNLSKLFFQAPFVYITQQTKTGQKLKFRAVSPQLSAGIIINKNVQTQADLDLFYSKPNHSQLNNITSISFDVNEAKYFDPNVKVELYKYMDVKE